MDELVFSGGVFSDAMDGGRAGAEIELSLQGVTARTPDGNRFDVSYGECQVEVGGFSGRMVFCRNHDRSLTIFCEDKKFARALSSASMGLLDEQLGAKLTARRRIVWRDRRIGAAIAVGLLVALVGGYFGIRAGARAAVLAVPLSVDEEIGTRAFQAMDLGGPEIHDPAVVRPLQSMVDRLAPHVSLDGLQFEVHVVDAPMVNAFCLPAGTIVVYTGLIENASDGEQVAGVLGHEMAHATLRHGLERISQALGLAAAVTFLLGDTQGLVAAGAELFQIASINSYSREQESAADAEAVRMMHAAGLDPMALTKFFETLHQQHGDLPGVVTWLSTHPQHEARIAAVRDQVANLPDREYRRLEIDWAAIQARIQRERISKPGTPPDTTGNSRLKNRF